MGDTTRTDKTLPIGARVRSTDGSYSGTVSREYKMPHYAPDQSWAFFSHPGRRVYVVILDNPRMPGGSVAIDAVDLEVMGND